jgi:hypothetical protein
MHPLLCHSVVDNAPSGKNNGDAVPLTYRVIPPAWASNHVALWQCVVVKTLHISGVSQKSLAAVSPGSLPKAAKV